jgi:hypothetical protein
MQNNLRYRVGGLRVLGCLSLISALSFSGCATPTRIPLETSRRDSFTSTESVVGLRQQEIAADIARSNVSAATGGGLIGAIIDASVENSRAKKAEGVIVPVRDALVGYEPGAVLAEALRQELTSLAWLKHDAVVVRQAPDNKSLPGWIEKSTRDAVLFVSTDYRFTPAFDAVVVTASVSVHPRTGPLKSAIKTKPGLPGLIYSNAFSISLPMPDLPAGKLTPAEACKLWAADKGEKVRRVLDECFTELPKMIAFDLEQAAPANNALYAAPDSQTEYVLLPTPGAPVPVMTRTFAVGDSSKAFVWRRHPGGELSAMRK